MFQVVNLLISFSCSFVLFIWVRHTRGLHLRHHLWQSKRVVTYREQRTRCVYTDSSPCDPRKIKRENVLWILMKMIYLPKCISDNYIWGAELFKRVNHMNIVALDSMQVTGQHQFHTLLWKFVTTCWEAYHLTDEHGAHCTSLWIIQQCRCPGKKRNRPSCAAI